MTERGTIRPSPPPVSGGQGPLGRVRVDLFEGGSAPRTAADRAVLRDLRAGGGRRFGDVAASGPLFF